MQEIHSIGGARFLGGGGDRRLRPQHRQNHQPLKCPRCDSLNTKFCYYNNYNLSQPRHFCKSCRRYWTKGGVLRNVPVGGGCRKSKRSKPKTASSEIAATPAPPAPSSQPPQQELNKSNSHSSSESSSLTAADTEAASAPSSSNCELLENMHESKFFNNQSSNPGFETLGMMEQGEDCGIFSEIGSFTSLITSTNEAMAFGFGNIAEASPFRFGNTHQGMGNDPLSGDWQPQHNGMGMSSPHQDLKMPEIIMPTGTSLLDQTLPVDLSALQSKTGNGGFGSLDWQGNSDQGLFDLPNTVDHAYWNHTNWTDQDNPSLFHLP